jgi:hypothetical protein
MSLCTSFAFSSILKLLAEAFPALNMVPKSYYDAKKLLRRLDLGYDSIHVCLNNLFYLGSNILGLPIVYSVKHRDGKTLRGREFHTKCYDIVHWHLGYKECLFLKKLQKKHNSTD